MLRFLAIQFSLGSRNSSLLHKQNKIILAVYSTQKELSKIHSHDSQREERRGSTLSPRGLEERETSLGCMIKLSAHASGDYIHIF